MPYRRSLFRGQGAGAARPGSRRTHLKVASAATCTPTTPSALVLQKGRHDRDLASDRLATKPELASSGLAAAAAAQHGHLKEILYGIGGSKVNLRRLTTTRCARGPGQVR